MNLHLIPIKTSRKKPKTGDVFLVQPIKGVYYYGKVISEKSNSKYELIKDFPLIYIYIIKQQLTLNYQIFYRIFLLPHLLLIIVLGLEDIFIPSATYLLQMKKKT